MHGNFKCKQQNKLPPVSNLQEADYQEMIHVLGKKVEELTEDFDNKQQDMMPPGKRDYIYSGSVAERNTGVGLELTPVILN